MKSNLKNALWIVAVLLFCGTGSQAKGQDVSTVIAQRLKSETMDRQLFTSVTNINAAYLSQASKFLSTLRTDGSWSDVNYADTDNDWSPLVHLERLLAMSYAYNKPSDRLYHKEPLRIGIQAAIDYWFKVNPVCVNWFKNEITRPVHFSTIGLLMQGKITESSLMKIAGVLPSAPIRSTTDRVRSAYSVLHKGVILKDPGLIRIAINGIAATYIQATGDGIQPDWSYHYHGALLYNGGYGLDLLNFTLILLPVVRGTSLDFTPQQMKLLDQFLTNGICQVVYGSQLDYSTMGRQIASTSRFVEGFIKHFEFLKTVFPEKKAFYQDMIDGILTKRPQQIAGNKHYRNSDFQVHRSTRYYTSVHMCSNRTIGMESLNYENLKGMWTPFGVNYILRKGDEYKDIFPVWDWSHLPGVTNPDTLIQGISGITQKTTFVGGVSNDKIGAAVMDFDFKNTTAKKSWFFFENEWVALGAGISSGNTNEVSTTINQCLLKGEVYVDGVPEKQRERQLINPHWVLQDSVGYVFPESQNVMLNVGKQSGSHSLIYAFGSKVKQEKDVFMLYIPHGVKPVDRTYSYIVVPGVSKTTLDAYARELPVRILQNTKAVQAVTCPSKGQTEIVFYEKGNLKINDQITVEVDKPCMVLLDYSLTGQCDVWISDPSALSGEINLELTIGGKKQFRKVNMPTAEAAGMSVRVAFPYPVGNIPADNQNLINKSTEKMTGTSSGFVFENQGEWKNVGQGVKRQILGYDKQLMVVKVAFEKGAIGSAHSHPHVQSTCVASGVFDVTIDGETKTLSVGDGFYVAPNLVHSVKCIQPGELIDTFSPVREDFLVKK